MTTLAAFVLQARHAPFTATPNGRDHDHDQYGSWSAAPATGTLPPFPGEYVLTLPDGTPVAATVTTGDRPAWCDAVHLDRALAGYARVFVTVKLLPAGDVRTAVVEATRAAVEAWPNTQPVRFTPGAGPDGRYIGDGFDAYAVSVPDDPTVPAVLIPDLSGVLDLAGAA